MPSERRYDRKGGVRRMRRALGVRERYLLYYLEKIQPPRRIGHTWGTMSGTSS